LVFSSYEADGRRLYFVFAQQHVMGRRAEWNKAIPAGDPGHGA
jgi:hypothetical protein